MKDKDYRPYRAIGNAQTYRDIKRIELSTKTDIAY